MSTTRPPQDPITYGVLETSKISDEIDKKVEELRFSGFCVLKTSLSSEKIAALRLSIDRLYSQQIAEVGGEEDAKGKAYADLVLSPLAFDPLFLDVATEPLLMQLCKRVLGENLLLISQNAVLNRPSDVHHQARWHRDLKFQHFVSSKPLALTALLCVDDFSAETGGTVILPGSHLRDEFPSNDFVLKHELQVEEKAGAILVIDSMVFHRTGLNLSKRPRRGVVNVIGRPFLAQQIDLPRILNGKYKDDPFLNRYLGYRWNPASDLKSWRMERQ